MVKRKVILTTILSVVFFIAVLIVVFFMFTIKKVDLKLTVSNQGYSMIEEIQPQIDKFVGKNLIVANLNDVKSVIEENPYFEVTEVKKSFPNVIEVSVNERKEVYALTVNDSVYILSEDGLVLSKKTSEQIKDSRLIGLTLLGKLANEEISVGEYVNLNKVEQLSVAFELAKSVGLTDCIKNMQLSIVSKPLSQDPTETVMLVVIDTYTGVQLELWDVEHRGLEKIQEGFSKYDQETSDYIKSTQKINVSEHADGVIRAVWVS